MNADEPAPLRPRPATLAAAVIMLATFAALAARMAWTTSATFDEPGFIVAGCSYQQPRTAEICTTNLRLVPLYLTAPLRFLHPKLPPEVETEPRVLASGDIHLGRAFLADPRNDGTRLLRLARCANILLGVVLGAILFGWSRRSYGDAAGLLTLGLYCLNPVIISNSALATTDLGTALLFVVAVATIARLLRRVSAGRVIACGLAVGALAAAKLSWPLLLPVAVVLALIRHRSREPVEFLWRGRAGAPAHRRTWLVAAVTGVAVIAYVTIWAVYGFHFTPGQPLPADAWAANHNGTTASLHRMIVSLREARLLPEAYLVDLDTFVATGSGRRAFLLGEYTINGWWYYFPVAWFLKSPLAFLLALALGIAALIATRFASARAHQPTGECDLSPLVVLGAVYLVAAMAGRLNIGIRHLLPVYPLLFVFAGSVMRWGPLPRWIRTGGMIALLGASAIETAAVHPEYLAYVNAFGGGADGGYKVLADSSYDWGQDLPAFEHWLNARAANHVTQPAYFSYFGNADLGRFKERVVLLPQYLDLRQVTFYALEPGTYVISATMLDSLFGPLMGPWRPSFETQYQELSQAMQRLHAAYASGGRPAFDTLIAGDGEPAWQRRILLHDYLRFARLCAWLRQREPSRRITRTLLVYELGDADLRAALEGPPPELRANYEVTGDAR